MASDNPLKTVLSWVTGLGSIALFGLIMLILFGNLSGNVGFDSGTSGYNNTNAMIGNYTESVTNTAAQFPTVGTILGIAVLLFILVAVAIYAMKKFSTMGGGSGSGSFG